MIRPSDAAVALVRVNTDVNATPGAIVTKIKHAKGEHVDTKNHLLVHSIFYTIQGEGPYAGIPAVFVRLAGCNLGSKTASGCQGCDTAFHLEDGKVMTREELVFEVVRSVPEDSRNWFFQNIGLVVVTGGEPGLQWPAILRFALASEELLDSMESSLTVQVETNGYGLSDVFAAQNADELEALNGSAVTLTVVYSPKANLRGYSKTSFDEVVATVEAVNEAVLDIDFHVKVVVDSDPQSLHHEVPDYMVQAYRDCDYVKGLMVSPLTVYHTSPTKGVPPSIWNDAFIDREATARNYAHAADLAMRHGLRVTSQMHTALAVA